MEHGTLTIDGKQFAVVPMDEYRQLKGGNGVKAKPDGVDWARAELGRNMREARILAGLTQAELAGRLRKSQVLVSQIEAGKVSAGERYVHAVLKACGLPKDWTPKGRSKR